MTTAKSYAEAQAALLKSGMRFETVFLDHDLEGLGNGQDVAFLLTRMRRSRRPGRVVVHSTNPAGAYGAFLTLEKKGFDVQTDPFPSLLARGAAAHLRARRSTRFIG